MRPADPVPEALRPGPFSLATGLQQTTASRLRGPCYQRLTRGAYWVADAPVTHGRLIEAFRAVLPPDAVLSGLSAAWALGLRWASAQEPVEVVVPSERKLRRREGLVVRRAALRPHEIGSTPLGAATSPARTAFDLARRAGPGQADQLARAVAQVDAVLRGCAVSADAARAVIPDHAGVRGSRTARLVLELADERSESWQESVLRVRIVLAGLPAPVPQYVVLDSRGQFVARLDLAWPAWRVGAEYDGAAHRDARSHGRDLRRHNALRCAGWTVLQLDARQLAASHDLLVDLSDLLAVRSRPWRERRPRG